MAIPFGSFRERSFESCPCEKTLPEEPSDGAKACQAHIVSTKKTLCPILSSVAGLPESPRPEKAFRNSKMGKTADYLIIIANKIKLL